MEDLGKGQVYSLLKTSQKKEMATHFCADAKEVVWLCS